jgi:predicted dehydrogenase
MGGIQTGRINMAAKKNYSLGTTAGARIAAPELPYRPSDPKENDLAIGLIGCGGITADHLRAYRAAGYRVVAMSNRTLARAVGRRDEFYPKADVCSDYRELLARPDIDVVDIATHPAERAAMIEDAIRAGKHVLSQKPLVLDLKTGRRLVALAKKYGVKLAVNQNGRWAPHVSYMRQAIARGLIGDVGGVHLSVHWNHNWVAGTPFDKVRHVVLFDFAIHWFDMLTCYMGDRAPVSVFTTLMRSKHQKAKPPLLAQVLVQYDGAQASLVFDADTKFGPQDRSMIVGSKGTLHSVGPNLNEQTVTLTTARGHASPKLVGSWFPDGFHGTMGELLCAIEQKREPSHSAAHNLRSLALCFAAIASVKRGKPVRPGSVDGIVE